MKCKELKTIILQKIDQYDLRNSLKDYAKIVKQTHTYNDFDTYFGWLIMRALFHPHKIVNLYDKYDCNDTHITTALKQVLKEII